MSTGRSDPVGRSIGSTAPVRARMHDAARVVHAAPLCAQF